MTKAHNYLSVNVVSRNLDIYIYIKFNVLIITKKKETNLIAIMRYDYYLLMVSTIICQIKRIFLVYTTHSFH